MVAHQQYLGSEQHRGTGSLEGQLGFLGSKVSRGQMPESAEKSMTKSVDVCCLFVWKLSQAPKPSTLLQGRKKGQRALAAVSRPGDTTQRSLRNRRATAC